MGETPFEPYFRGPRGRGYRQRAPLRRSFRCRAALPRTAVAPLGHYEEFVRLHESLSARPRVRAGRLWACGAGTALAVAVLMFTGVVLVRGGLGVEAPVFGERVGTRSAALAYGLSGLVASLQATALLHVLLSTAERPLRAFVWLGAMAVMVLTLLPLTLRVPASSAWGTAALNLAGGATVVFLLGAVARSCVVRERP